MSNFQADLVVSGWGISYEIALIWMSLDHIYGKSTLVQVMAWCRQATSHYLRQCWPRSQSPYGVIRPQWVKEIWYVSNLYYFPILRWWYWDSDSSFAKLCCNVIIIFQARAVGNWYKIHNSQESSTVNITSVIYCVHDVAGVSCSFVLP